MLIKKMITDNTIVYVGTDEIRKTTWGAFKQCNPDVDFDAILSVWNKNSTATYHGGGGAEGEWTIRIA